MNFLVVNDDGYQAEGLHLLIKYLKKYGTVKVISPSIEQSAMSHRITLTTGLKLTKVNDDVEFYHLDGSPADCVRLGVSLFDKIDLVFSGINNGMNIGIDTLYSGTLSAALEANIHGLNSIAISTPKNTFSVIEKYIDQVIGYLISINKGNKFCLNVNFPENPSSILGYKFTKCGFFIDPQKLTLHDDDTYRADDYILRYEDDETIDYYAFTNGYISITPITTDKTDYSLLNELNKV